jgi:hypothetical protein
LNTSHPSYISSSTKYQTYGTFYRHVKDRFEYRLTMLAVIDNTEPKLLVAMGRWTLRTQSSFGYLLKFLTITLS